MTAGRYQPPSYYRQQRRGVPPWLVIAVAVAIALVVGGGLACALGIGPFSPAATPSATSLTPTLSPTDGSGSSPGAQPTPPPDASPGVTVLPTPGLTDIPQTPPPFSIPPPTANDATAALLLHVPESIRTSCVPGTFVVPVVALVTCQTSPEVAVSYSQYPDDVAMYVDYNDSVDRAEIDRDSGLCFDTNPDGTLTATMDRWPSEHEYSVVDSPTGRYFCIERGLPTITWTDDNLNIMSIATASTGDADRLVTFWVNEAGPIP